MKKTQPFCPGSRDLNWTGKGLMNWACNVVEGLDVFLLKKNMVDGCGYSEVGRGYIYIFSSEMFSHVCMGTDIRDLVTGYPLSTYIYPLRYTGRHLLAYTYIHCHCTKLAHNF
jgi:hypothetical protein